MQMAKHNAQSTQSVSNMLKPHVCSVTSPFSFLWNAMSSGSPPKTVTNSTITMDHEYLRIMLSSDDIGWGKDMLFRQTPIAPQLAAWPSHHFHDIHHAAVHPGAKCWQMPLDPFCSFTALFQFPLTQSSAFALPALGPLPIRSHKKPTCHPSFPPSSQLHSMKRVQERIVEDFQILKDFNLFQTSISSKIHKFSHPHPPKQPKQPLPLWRHQRM